MMSFQMRKNRTKASVILAVCVFLFSLFAAAPAAHAVNNQGDPPQWILDKEGISRDDFMAGGKPSIMINRFPNQK